MAKKNNDDAQELLLAIYDSILEKKGEDILILNIGKIPNSVTNYFVICHGNSDIHVNTIAQYVEHNVRKTLREKAWKKEGYENSEWILLDYVNVVVHIFQKRSRDFYRLEELWADAEQVELKISSKSKQN
ncbi:MAG TPA: ribosome silencing factor [Bacteroidales bacterium]|jgi:ribosome-associated protein|nr:ribosome silencing factor [Bacteroidales bacterium]HOL97232.1 ribosome silencing factor [Bacteroidales bacterium]HOM35524.1 ribosome silencing factor [Bacteroidales bacterium]HPD23855.1 ribosome silencing factor [Bacteroidales bacterium]HRS98779.1 ribosome silencing factor [Bacteroidales bacterium]